MTFMTRSLLMLLLLALSVAATKQGHKGDADSVFMLGDSITDTVGPYGFWELQASLGIPEDLRLPLARLGYVGNRATNGDVIPQHLDRLLDNAEVKRASPHCGEGHVLRTAGRHGPRPRLRRPELRPALRPVAARPGRRTLTRVQRPQRWHRPGALHTDSQLISVCPNPKNYMWWDGVHLTDEVHRIIAGFVKDSDGFRALTAGWHN
ncbi:hypothetical protein FOA52_000749 [Chlamydomonas sp. UWO 241]|nr:hypothetical protein FOA52_000749 [Chlamydomonas sp. UWO 241]